MKNRTLRTGLWILIGIVAFVNIVFFNVLIHEAGHYIAAYYYGLEPKISLELSNARGVSFNFEALPLASTSFIDNGDKNELFAVVLFGPFMNLLLSIVFLFVFVSFKRNWAKDLAIMGFVISLGSFLMNVLPIPGADGAILFGLI